MPADTKLYDILGVPPGADDQTIKKAYRKLARRFHPDKNPGDAEAEARFKEANAAHEVLSDPERRALYDEFGEVSLQQGFDADKAREFRRWQQQAARAPGGFSYGDRAASGFGGRGAPGFGYGGFGGPGGIDEDFLSSLFGGGRRRGPRRGADLRAELHIDFRQAAAGGQQTLTFADGRSIRVRIPPGGEDMDVIRLKGQGQPGAQGAPAGDLLITLRVEEDPIFRRDGLDLHLDAPVTVGEALRGAAIRVPTLGGAVKLKVPPGSQSGRVLRVPGKGVERPGRGTGDLYVHLQVQVPAPGPGLDEAIDTLEEAYRGDVRAGLFQQRSWRRAG